MLSGVSSEIPKFLVESIQVEKYCNRAEASLFLLWRNILYIYNLNRKKYFTALFMMHGQN